ncbi:MAG: hypothetical protein ABJQ29_15315 [Luteolibacter sp.]
MKIPTVIFLLAACLAFFAHAQEESKKLGVTFTCLLLEELPVEQIFYKEGKSYLPLEFKKGKRSEAYSLRSNKVFELYVSEVNEDGDSFFKPVGSSALVAGSRKILFIIAPGNSESGLPLRIIGLDDSLEGFPPGSFRFVNFTDTELLVKVRDKVTRLESGEITVADSESSEDGGLVPVTFGNSKGETLHFTRLYSHSRSREMVFIGKSKDPKRKFQFMFVPQNVPDREPAPWAQ